MHFIHTINTRTRSHILVVLSRFAVSIANVTVTTPPGLMLYGGTFIDIMCNVILSDSVDTGTTIMYQWLGPALLTDGSDYTITGNTLRINRLSVSRDNGRTITCMATAMNESQYVLQSTGSNNIQLTVEGEY